jgi:hypothetical protein
MTYENESNEINAVFAFKNKINSLEHHHVNGNRIDQNNNRQNSDDDSNKQVSKLNDLKKSYSTILKSVGEDVMREGLLKTPDRAAKAIIDFTVGYKFNLNGNNR